MQHDLVLDWIARGSQLTVPITVTGIPVAGQVPIATSPTAAQWGTIRDTPITASGDVTGVTDLAAINAALATTPNVATLYQGIFYINGPISIGSFSTLQGQGAGPGETTVQMVATSGAAVNITQAFPASTVAAGSNGGTISGIAAWGTPGAGVLAVASAAGFATAGAVFVATSTTVAYVTYSGKTANTLTGCQYVSGSAAGTVATGGAVNQAPASGGIINPAINGIYLAGPNSGTGTGISGGAPWLPIEGLSMDNVFVSGFGGAGVDLATVIASRIDNLDTAGNGGDGFRLTAGASPYTPGPGTPTSTTVRNSYSHSNKGHGYILQNANYCALVGCASDDNGITSGYGYYINNCENIALTGCGVEVPRAAGATPHGFVIDNASVGIGLTSCLVAGIPNGGIGFWIKASSVKCSLMSCQEINPIPTPAASFQNDVTCDALIMQPQYTTAPVLSGNYQMILAGATTLRTLTTTGVTAQFGGTSTAGSAPALTPAFANGTAAQLSDLTRDYMVYLQVGTPGTVATLAIGPTSGVANVIKASHTPTAGDTWMVRLPAGWFLKWAGTSTTITTQIAIGC